MHFIGEFNHMAGFNINQMMVVSPIGQIITRAPAAKIPPFQNAAFFKQAHGAINCRNRNAPIALQGTPMQFLNIRVILRLAQDARDQAALPGHLQALLHAHRFNARSRRHFRRVRLWCGRYGLGQGSGSLRANARKKRK
jgi:hypothetical protein